MGVGVEIQGVQCIKSIKEETKLTRYLEILCASGKFKLSSFKLQHSNIQSCSRVILQVC